MGCTRKGHNPRPTICAGEVKCMHCDRDQKSRSSKSQAARTAKRNKDFKWLRKKLPPGEVEVLDKLFAEHHRNVDAGMYESKSEKTAALKKIYASECFLYPFPEFQILSKNYRDSDTKRQNRNVVPDIII